MKIFLFLCLLVFATVNSSASVLDVTFDSQNEGIYTETLAYTDFPYQDNQNFWSNSWYELGYERGTIVVDSISQSKVLRVKYPKGCLGPNGATGCGVQIKYPLPDSAETMWLSYQIFFEEGFDFVKGGKLPGLCGGECYTGGNVPSTGDGWSARIMWRTGGRVVQYLYFVDQTGTYGDDAKWDLGRSITQKVFVPGIWHTVVTKIELNSVPVEGKGSKNGKMRSWFDGDLALDLDTLRLRDYAAQKIDKFYFSTFHGGSDSTWVPSVDSYIRYDNIVVSKDSIPITKGSLGLLLGDEFHGKTKLPRMLVGNKIKWETPLPRSMRFFFYGTDGRLRISKIGPQGTTEMQLPLKNEVFFLKVQ
jgi:hypothetical protein